MSIFIPASGKYRTSIKSLYPDYTRVQRTHYFTVKRLQKVTTKQLA